MGSSFTEFQGYGFWARDAGIEVWLWLLAKEIERQPEVPGWLAAAGRDWAEKATGGFIGCVDAALDEHLCDPSRIEAAIQISQRALAWLYERGPVLSKDLLNSMQVGGPGRSFLGDVEIGPFVRVGEAFIRLLRGELKTDASTSRVL